MHRWAKIAALLGKGVEIGAYLAWEKVRQPKVTRAGEVPGAPEAITPAWLTSVLCRGRPGAEVVGVALGAGSSGSTQRRRLAVSYNQAGRRMVEAEAGKRGGLPATLFAKMTASITSRLAYSGGAMVDEALFFNAIRPELELEAPWGYHAAYDLRTCRSIQLMEDLETTRDARFCTPQTSIGRAEAEDIVATLAALHGKFYRDPRLDSEFTTLRTLSRWYESAEPFQLDKYHALAMEKAAAVIPPRLYARRHETWPAFTRALALHERLPPTLLHSDVHLGNWYVTGEGRMGLCDWGCIVKGHWSRDFAYAVTAALTVDDRRSWERELLALYLDRMHAAGGERLGFDEAWLRYRQQTFQGLVMWTPTLCHSPLLPDMQPEAVAVEMIKRITAAIDDLDSLENVAVRAGPTGAQRSIRHSTGSSGTL